MINARRGLPARLRSLDCNPLRFPLPPDPSPLHLGSPTAGAGPRQDAQVIRDHPEADPALHPARPTIATAPEPVAPLEDADAAFAPGAPAQRPAEPTLARRRGLRVRPWPPAGSWQHHFAHAQFGGGALVGGRGKPAIGHGQLRRLAKEFLMLG